MPVAVNATGINDIVSRLSAATNYHSKANVEVQLPQGSEVAYDIELWATESPTDRLAPCSYLIEWKLPTPNGESEGFTAYTDGNLFRHTDTRLQEYHFQWDSIPFIVNGGRNGIQRNAQFTNLLPQFIAQQIEEITSSDKWTYRFSADTIRSGLHVALLEGRMEANGVNARNALYVLDPKTSLPIYIEIENNPTSISEQILVIKYSDTSVEPIPALTEEQLADRHPDVFDNYRESNFSAETLRGKPFPSFSLPTTTGERYQHQKLDPFRQPTMIAIIDPSASSTADVFKSLRSAASMSPVPSDIIFALVSTNIDTAEEASGQVGEGEHLLISSRPLARDCGVASYPTFFIVDSAGNVSDVIIGYSSDLSTKLLEKISITR